eukprot:scaffold20624_cov22-Tisochrysis_lutea.AAC.2
MGYEAATVASLYERLVRMCLGVLRGASADLILERAEDAGLQVSTKSSSSSLMPECSAQKILLGALEIPAARLAVSTPLSGKFGAPSIVFELTGSIWHAPVSTAALYSLWPVPCTCAPSCNIKQVSLLCFVLPRRVRTHTHTHTHMHTQVDPSLYVLLNKALAGRPRHRDLEKAEVEEMVEDPGVANILGDDQEAVEAVQGAAEEEEEEEEEEEDEGEEEEEGEGEEQQQSSQQQDIDQEGIAIQGLAFEMKKKDFNCWQAGHVPSFIDLIMAAWELSSLSSYFFTYPSPRVPS